MGRHPKPFTIASVWMWAADFRFSPGNGLRQTRSPGPVRTKSRRMQCSKLRRQTVYSITSSARARSDGGTVRPSAFAVLMLITSSNLVGA
jgi:hypothetical protein